MVSWPSSQCRPGKSDARPRPSLCVHGGGNHLWSRVRSHLRLDCRRAVSHATAVLDARVESQGLHVITQNHVSCEHGFYFFFEGGWMISQATWSRIPWCRATRRAWSKSPGPSRVVPRFLQPRRTQERKQNPKRSLSRTLNKIETEP